MENHIETFRDLIVELGAEIKSLRQEKDNNEYIIKRLGDEKQDLAKQADLNYSKFYKMQQEVNTLKAEKEDLKNNYQVKLDSATITIDKLNGNLVEFKIVNQKLLDEVKKLRAYKKSWESAFNKKKK